MKKIKLVYLLCEFKVLSSGPLFEQDHKNIDSSEKTNWKKKLLLVREPRDENEMYCTVSEYETRPSQEAPDFLKASNRGSQPK